MFHFRFAYLLVLCTLYVEILPILVFVPLRVDMHNTIVLRSVSFSKFFKDYRNTPFTYEKMRTNHATPLGDLSS
jgi:hypothetical protein